MTNVRRAALAFAAAALCGGCALTVRAPDDALSCAAWLESLDARVDAEGVRDAQARQLPGFPLLRVDRPLASLRTGVASESKLAALVGRMRALDAEGRAAEIANLGLDAREARETLERVQRCAGRMAEADLADPEARARLLARARVPDDYSTGLRVLGLYALTKYPFFAGVRQYQEEVLESFRASAQRETRRFAPPPADAVPRARLAVDIASASANPLGVPEPRGAALERLLAAHAPVFDLEQTGDFDRPGALRWEKGAETPSVDPDDPVVYAMASWTRYRGRALLQLVYTLWFPERPAASALDLLSGALDGVVWRVTLAPDGEPLVYDSMHPCGCYHMFFPTARARPVPPPEATLEWMFSPQSLPRVAEGERPVLRIATRTHYIEAVALARTDAGDTRYAIRPYDTLRSLPRPEGGRRSAFGPDGLIAGTERAERFLFWPMGIDSPGAMRQWGRHPTAFVGRRHFDDADLLEKRFVLELP